MKVAVFNFNGVFDVLKEYLASHGELEENWTKADVVVLWQDILSPLRDLAYQARGLGKKVLVGEHGLGAVTDYIPPVSLSLAADKIMVWGEYCKRLLMEKSDVKEDQIIVTGTTIFDGFKPKRIHQGKNVLFAPCHWTEEIPENLKLLEELGKLEDVRVFSKIVLGEHNPEIYPCPFISQRQHPNHLDHVWQALSIADVMVTVGESTISACAYYMDIPVISLDEWSTKKMNYKVYDKKSFFEIVSDALRLEPINNINNAIMEELKHPEISRPRRLKFLYDYVEYGSETPPLKRMLDAIYE